MDDRLLLAMVSPELRVALADPALWQDVKLGVGSGVRQRRAAARRL